MFRKQPRYLFPEIEYRLFSPIMLDRSKRTENEAMIRALCHTAYLGGDMAVCRVLGRYKMFVDTTDIGLSVHLMLDGYWEMWLTEAIATVVKPGMTVVDIGANLGYFTLLMAEIVRAEGATGTVHAFEPNRGLASRIRRSAVVNGYGPWVHVHEVPLGEEDGARTRLIVPEGDPKNAVTQLLDSQEPDDASVLIGRRLDSYPALHEASVVKIDADTAERGIWNGMTGILDKERSMTIFLEFNASRYIDPAEFLKEITDRRFSISYLSPADGPTPSSVDQVLARQADEDQILMLVR
jgi:FkbM family methyltransferase